MLTAPTALVALLAVSGALVAADSPGTDPVPDGVPWWVSLFLLPLFTVAVAWLRKKLRVPETEQPSGSTTAPPPVPSSTDGQLAWAQRMCRLLEDELADEKARVRDQALALAERDGRLVAMTNRIAQLEDEVARLMLLVDTLSGRPR